MQPIAGVERVTILERSAGGPPGRDLDIRLSGAPLKTDEGRGAGRSRISCRAVPGLTGIEDNLPWGKQELVMELTDAGRAMGFTTQAVARQVRDAFEGAVAKRFTREQEEIIVRVKLAEATSVRDTIRDLYLRSGDGAEVPLTEVVTLTRRVGFSQIRREDGMRQVAVTADVDPEVTTTNEVMAVVNRDVLPGIRQQFGVQAGFRGKAEEQAEALADMRIAVLLALAGIYVILAWVFASYGTPLIVMALIPFGLVGAIFGHWVMGFNVNMLSLQAILGLSGVIINDTIILVKTVRTRLARGRCYRRGDRRRRDEPPAAGDPHHADHRRRAGLAALRGQPAGATRAAAGSDADIRPDVQALPGAVPGAGADRHRRGPPRALHDPAVSGRPGVGAIEWQRCCRSGCCVRSISGTALQERHC